MIMTNLTGFKRGILLTLFLGITFLLSSCGGSSNKSNDSNNSSGSGGLFITDDLSDDYQQVIATIYKIEFESASDGSLITVFEDAQGITYDLSELNGVLSRLSTSVPSGNYSRVLITVDEGIILVDNLTGLSVTPNPKLAGTCNAGRCIIEVPGQFNVVDGQSVILDFDLKQFTYDPGTNTVTAIIVLDADGSTHVGYPEIRDDDYDLKGFISSIDILSNRFDITVIKTEHFIPSSNVVTVLVGPATWYTCDNDNRSSCNIQDISDLQEGMKVEIQGSPIKNWFDASMGKVVLDEYDDIDIAMGICTAPSRSITDFSNLRVQQEIELRGNPSYTFDRNNYSITVSNKTILLTIETRIKLENNRSQEQIICADQIPSSAYKIEVKYYQGLDFSGNPVYIAYKVGFDK
ncbi:MAG: DUF4382 domain-containing protein [Thermodesulfobacteriota bacterium]